MSKLSWGKYLVVGKKKECNEMLKKKNLLMGVHQKDTKPTEKTPSGQSWGNLDNKVNHIDWSQKYKINIHELMLI